MSAIAERIEQALRSLPAEQSGKFEALLSHLLVFAEQAASSQSAGRISIPYHTQPQPLDLKAGLSYDNWAELLDAAEGPCWK